VKNAVRQHMVLEAVYGSFHISTSAICWDWGR